ncbi:MAG: FAD-dependent oxidoreductase, partial [Clostridia bacterium]|nr:FAD-dependent oxidoreductase [Clostridia bacterium]
PGSWKNGEPEKPTVERYCTQYSPYLFAMQLMEEVTSLGIDLLYDCTAAEPVMEGCRCTGVVTVSKSGLTFSPCGVLIDTTGDSDLLRAAGVRTAERGNFFTYYGRAVTLRGCKKAWETGNIREVYSTRSGGMINLFGDNQPDNVPLWHGTAAEDVTDYLIKNQKKMLAALKEEDRLSRDMAWMPGMPQFRTTCRICGEYTFTVKDAYRHHTDSICAINDFEHRDHLFEVPYGCLYQKEFPNLLTAGRSASGDGYGWDLLRVIPPAILTGQAAGEAASLALESKTSVSGVSVPLLQKRLEERNVMIHFPDEYVPEDKTVVIHGKNADGHAEGHI